MEYLHCWTVTRSRIKQVKLRLLKVMGSWLSLLSSLCQWIRPLQSQMKTQVVQLGKNLIWPCQPNLQTLPLNRPTLSLESKLEWNTDIPEVNHLNSEHWRNSKTEKQMGHEEVTPSESNFCGNGMTELVLQPHPRLQPIAAGIRKNLPRMLVQERTFLKIRFILLCILMEPLFIRPSMCPAWTSLFIPAERKGWRRITQRRAYNLEGSACFTLSWLDETITLS